MGVRFWGYQYWYCTCSGPVGRPPLFFLNTQWTNTNAMEAVKAFFQFIHFILMSHHANSTLEIKALDRCAQLLIANVF